ncbi:Lrp/AsnC family transcriptional regulator [Chloroflexota bacterium]
MDELYLRLIAELQIDPRKSNTWLAKSLGIAEATVRRRIEHLVSSGTLILTALPDLKKVGYPTHVLIGLQVEHSRLNEIAEQLCYLPSLRLVSTCTGFTDIFLRGDFTSTEALADFITGYLGNIPGVRHIDTMLEYKEIKRTHGRIENSQIARMTASQTGDITISETDRRLINQLQKNARAPFKELAYYVGLSESTIYRRIKELVGSGAIELTAIPNGAKIGYPVRGHVEIEAEPPEISHVAEFIAQYPQVSYVGLFSGPVPILIGTHSSSPEELDDFTRYELKKIEGITRVTTLITLKVLKHAFTWL